MNSILNNEKIKLINFYEELSYHKEYLMPDNIHLTDKGNLRLNEILKANLFN